MSVPKALVIKWAGKEIHLEGFEANATVADLKRMIKEKTSVLPERQKLLNLKYKGKSAGDELALATLALKDGFKIMMMGSLEADIKETEVKPENIPEVVNDFDIDEEEIAIENRSEYLSKIDKRIRDYEVKMLNPLRDGKKLLVLDIDYTLFDHRSVAESGRELMRPFLHDFLASAYEDYDIVIWSATSMKWIEEKMKLLGCVNHALYKLSFYLDSLAMISVHTPKYGVIEVKPLGVVWGKFPQFTRENTIMFDDLRRNFIMNPQSGLRIKAFREAHTNRDSDRELLKLAEYLKKIARLTDFSELKHKYWESFE